MSRFLTLFLLAATLCCLAEDPPPKAIAWPPETGHPYPNLSLVDQTGERVSLSSFKGKVLLLEPVGMT